MTYGQTPNRGSTGKTEIGSQSQRLENVSATANSSIDGNADAALGDGGNFTENIESRGDGVELSAAVVGDDDAVESVLDGELGILNSVDCIQSK